ncbi:hypothetical protein J6590_012244 [Homalodisca vitripennis]|nr:hypothetical protein J6590_012244 [Homalodisca vitripennis]
MEAVGVARAFPRDASVSLLECGGEEVPRFVALSATTSFPNFVSRASSAAINSTRPTRAPPLCVQMFFSCRLHFTKTVKEHLLYFTVKPLPHCPLLHYANFVKLASIRKKDVIYNTVQSDVSGYSGGDDGGGSGPITITRQLFQFLFLGILDVPVLRVRPACPSPYVC